jgi:hypothetical protein
MGGLGRRAGVGDGRHRDPEGPRQGKLTAASGRSREAGICDAPRGKCPTGHAGNSPELRPDPADQRPRLPPFTGCRVFPLREAGAVAAMVYILLYRRG